MLNVEAKRHGDRFKIGLLLTSVFVDFESSLDLLGRHALAFAIFTVDANALLGGLEVSARLSSHFLVTIHAHLPSKLGILIDLLFGVPEPLVDLVLLQVKLIRQVCDSLAVWSLAIQVLVHIPKSVLLAL